MKQKTTSFKKWFLAQPYFSWYLTNFSPLIHCAKAENLLHMNVRYKKIFTEWDTAEFVHERRYKIINLKLYFKKLWIKVMNTHAWTSENNTYLSPQINAQTKVSHFFLCPNKIKHLHLDYHFTIFTWNNVYLYILTNMYK